jgi:hypothetical protein
MSFGDPALIQDLGVQILKTQADIRRQKATIADAKGQLKELEGELAGLSKRLFELSAGEKLGEMLPFMLEEAGQTPTRKRKGNGGSSPHPDHQGAESDPDRQLMEATAGAEQAIAGAKTSDSGQRTRKPFDDTLLSSIRITEDDRQLKIPTGALEKLAAAGIVDVGGLESAATGGSLNEVLPKGQKSKVLDILIAFRKTYPATGPAPAPAPVEVAAPAAGAEESQQFDGTQMPGTDAPMTADEFLVGAPGADAEAAPPFDESEPVDPSTMVEEEPVAVPMPPAMKTAATIRIGRMGSTWFVGWDLVTDSAGEKLEEHEALTSESQSAPDRDKAMQLGIAALIQKVQGCEGPHVERVLKILKNLQAA